MRLYNATVALLEAKARLLNEKANTLDLGTYARGIEDGRADVMAEYGIDAPMCADPDDE